MTEPEAENAPSLTSKMPPPEPHLVTPPEAKNAPSLTSDMPVPEDSE